MTEACETFYSAVRVRPLPPPHSNQDHREGEGVTTYARAMVEGPATASRRAIVYEKMLPGWRNWETLGT
jgi:hypothetical protein